MNTKLLSRSARCGFNLLEILVVVAIMAVLIGISLPAIQYARASAARNECATKLNQLGIAFHQYHTLHRALPVGVSVRDGKDPLLYMSWQARLLPVLDEQVLWQQASAAITLVRQAQAT